jgi:RNase P subunit RPR2
MDDVSRELERIQNEAQQKSEQQAAAVAAVEQAELCSEHPRMHLDYFCKSCQTPLCSGTDSINIVLTPLP